MAILENQLWDLAAIERGQKLVDRPNASHKQQLDKLNRMVADWERRVDMARPRCRQIQHLIKKFGGIVPFAVACNRHPDRIIRFWLGVTKKGRVERRWGLIPSMGMLLRLVVVARSYGIVLTPEDLFPDLIADGHLKNPHANPELLRWAMAISPEDHARGNVKSMQELETQIAELVRG